MTEITPISRNRVKLTARKHIQKNFVAAIKANWIVILFNLFQTALVLTTTYLVLLNYHQTGQLVYFNQRSAYFSQTIASTVALVFSWSAKWAIVDQFQDPKAKVTWSQSIQAFRFGRFFATFMLAFVQNILLFLWSALVIPGFVKSFSYSQTYYAFKMDSLFGRQQKSLTDYISISRRVMSGRKMELFQLELSFLGWHLLGYLTFGLAYIYVTPYLNTARVVYSSQVFAQALQKGEA